MQKSLLISCLSLGLLLPGILRADVADDFLKAYFLIQDSDATEKSGDTQKAAEKFASALKILRHIKQVAPDWNQNIIVYRIKYCSDHVLKNGGTLPVEDASAGNEPSTVAAEPAPAPTVAPVVLAAPIPEPVVESVPAPSPERAAARERELDRARAEAQNFQEEAESSKRELELRLRKTEQDLKLAAAEIKATAASSDEKIQALLKENQSLGKENKALREELAGVQTQYQALKKDYEEIKGAYEVVKKDLEETRAQLRTVSSNQVSSDDLQTLQKENNLLRAIAERQYQEDSRRMAAGEKVSRSLEDLKMHLEELATPLSPLSRDEKRVIRVSGSTKGNDPTKLNATIKAEEPSSMPRGKAPIRAPAPAASGSNGKVVIVNSKDNFVVINFHPGTVPSARTELGVYRGDELVGSVRITEPIKPPVAPADIISGNLRKGDFVR